MDWSDIDAQRSAMEVSVALARAPMRMGAPTNLQTMLVIGGGNAITGGGTGIKGGSAPPPATAYNPATMPTCPDDYGWGTAYYHGVSLGLVAIGNQTTSSPFILSGCPAWSAGPQIVTCSDGTTMTVYYLV